MPKLLAEGSPAEQQIVLGCLLDTRCLLVSLPDDKYTAWTETIARIVREKGCTKGELDTLEGQLNHAAYVKPLARHFLIRLRTVRNSKSNKKVDRTCPFQSQPLAGATPTSKRGDLNEPRRDMSILEG